jgi:NAD(P)-dependent dehydrogenase (short-subunit alcohol dehydrogenase family)
MNLKNKIIIVTGGSGLIGSEIVKKISSLQGQAINFDINIVTNIDKGEVNVDLEDDNSIEDAIKTVIKNFGRIDGLVNCAYPRTSDWNKNFNDVSPESFRKNIELQLSQIFVLTQKVTSYMEIQQSGSIVNIASIYGIVGNDFSLYEETNITPPVAYSAIKGGLISFNRFIASYFGKNNIRSNCVSPGGVYDNQDSKFVKKYSAKTPLLRMALPSDIAPIICFLLSDESSYITGQNIAVDGGYTIK